MYLSKCKKLTSNEGFVHFELVFLVNVFSTVNRLHFCTDFVKLTLKRVFCEIPF